VFHRRIPLAAHQRFEFHVSSKREEEAKPATPPPAAAEPVKGWWDPIYAVPLGIAFAVPAVHYEWYLVTEETQLAACFIMFTALIYKNFGATFGAMLEEDGKRIIEDANKVEDGILTLLKNKKEDLMMMENIVQDAKDIHTLKEETYVKLNAAGKIKPLHEFKTQMERVLHMIAVEEAAVVEKKKVELMKEATIAVTNELLTNKDLQKVSLENAIAQLKGEKPGQDPVKQTYLQFFQWKSAEAKKMDPAAETAVAREAVLKKINATAANEKFFFQFDAKGKPEMLA
jgi:Mitochondrial ATP synthase B chain precursor (ATP-synt_B)